MSALLDHHARMLALSAIGGEVARERGYFSVERKRDLEQLGFARTQLIVPTLVVPVHGVVNGEAPWYVHRPDEPRQKDGRVVKYEIPRGRPVALDVHPRARPHLGNPACPLFITEGSKKVDALITAGAHAVIGVIGVWNWRGRNDDGGLAMLPDWEWVALNDGRQVYVVYDSDIIIKQPVALAMNRLGAALKRMGATVAYTRLASGEGGAKVGADDYLAGGGTLDGIVALSAAAPPEPPTVTVASGQNVAPESEAPLVRTARLITDVGALIDRFAVLPNRASALAIALFVLHTYAFEAAHATPYLVIRSPVKRAGKTRVEELLELVVRSPWRIAAASESAMFRKIDASRPTLLLDEVDALFGSSSEGTEPVRAILNAGNRPGAAVARVVGEGAGMTVADFSVYCPKVLAGIGTTRWPDTITDRAIVIELRRKKPDEHVERLRHRKLHVETEGLRGRLARWAVEHVDALRDADVELPPRLDDPAAEGWEPLLAIADLADRERQEDWGARARRAAVQLADGRIADDDAHGVVLLAALRKVFAESDVAPTEVITRALNADEDLPFGAFRRGDGIDGRGLARLLKPFGIRPRNVWIGGTAGKPVKGYRAADFADAWERYCPRQRDVDVSDPQVSGSDPLGPLGPRNHGRFGGGGDPLGGSDLADQVTGETSDEHGDLADLADTDAEPGGPTSNGELATPEQEALYERLSRKYGRSAEER